MVFQARRLNEADWVAAALQEAGIRQFRKIEGSRASARYCIFVPSEVEAQARRVVATFFAEEGAKAGHAPSQRIDGARPRLRAIAIAVFVIVVVGGFALVVLGWLNGMRGH